MGKNHQIHTRKDEFYAYVTCKINKEYLRRYRMTYIYYERYLCNAVCCIKMIAFMVLVYVHAMHSLLITLSILSISSYIHVWDYSVWNIFHTENKSFCEYIICLAKRLMCHLKVHLSININCIESIILSN